MSDWYVWVFSLLLVVVDDGFLSRLRMNERCIGFFGFDE